jgi:hypothetical protein
MIWTMIAITFWIGWCPPEGLAMLAPAVTGEIGSDAARTTDLQTVQHVLESKVIQQRLLDLGLTADEIQARLATLSDQDVHELALHLDALAPGGDALGIIIVLLVVAIIVVLVIYLMGHKIVVEKEPGVEKK